VKTIKGPGIFLAQFMGAQTPFDTLAGTCAWAAGLGFKAVQMPTNDPRFFNLEAAAESHAYCDDLRGALAGHGLVISELSTHLQGQLVAVHPAYDSLFAGFAPAQLKGNEPARRAWATDQLMLAAKASRNLGLAAHATFSGALAWPYFYSWPQRPKGLVEEAFRELAARWTPILNAFDEVGVDVCFELHPGEDLHDGVTFERFLEATGNHPRAKVLFDPSHMLLQQMDYLAFLDLYHPYVRAFHVKDAEYRASGRSGVYGGYLGWVERPGRFRTAGMGQVNFGAIFAKLAQYDYPGWAVLEWEDSLQSAEDGAQLGAQFIDRQLIRVTGRAFDNFAAAEGGPKAVRRLLGIEPEAETGKQPEKSMIERDSGR
jgi:sugar phosphate isomerase/epimerase